MFFSKAINPAFFLQRGGPGGGGARPLSLRDCYRIALPEGGVRKPLVVFAGGFLDEALMHMYATCVQYCNAGYSAYQDIYFRPFHTPDIVRELVESYASAGQKTALIGHSWGGDAVVNGVALKTRAAIDILATLDPVSRKGAPESKPTNVGKFINVYIDYDRAALVNAPNTVARIGGPWRKVPCADENHDILGDAGVDADGRGFDHADASAMFWRYAAGHVAALHLPAG
jgi:pimeloyl-ACP methyl ester carboxylesterase